MDEWSFVEWDGYGGGFLEGGLGWEVVYRGGFFG